MNEMIERVARALMAAEKAELAWDDMARAAIEAMREPTEAMKESGANGICGIIQGVGENSEKHFVRLWHSAIEAALKEKGGA